MVSLLSCNDSNESQLIEANKNEKAKNSEEKERIEVKDQLEPLVFTHCILIVGGSPSLSPKLPIDSVYSSRLQHELENRYQVLNAAAIHERDEALFTRLHNLPPHQLELIILEIGYDESLFSKSDQVFEKKLEKVLAFVKSINDQLPIVLIPSDFNEKKLEKLERVARTSSSVNILEGDGNSIHSIDWHSKITKEIISYLERTN